MNSRPTPEEARRFLLILTRALSAVAVLALVSTAINVTLFAVSRGVPWPIAGLLDPMLALGLVVALYGEARLAAWGVRPSGWSTALRWFTGTVATLMNVWPSLWPTGRIGWPADADLAGVVLHATPTLLLVLVTETIAAYRRAAAPLLQASGQSEPADPLASTDPLPDQLTAPGAAPAAGSLPVRHHASISDRPDAAAESTPESGLFTPAPPTPDTVLRQLGPVAADSAPNMAPSAPVGQGVAQRPPVGDVWERALALDASVRSATGRSVSVWRLRRDLHIGPDRARQLHDQLLTHHAANRPVRS
ncbi:extensin [Streptomyces sp. TRM66268-LWL]|uniref:Extensin n=1 Tax=Streptomyces polyasparticus TaxID=2767826 RepID=A0ABR7SXI3_9ACTN|nr:extensin [Streptomyces polyasparticus]MBC9719380.1 extensin [Streptomyces polyasparticus]